jgi:F1F0 ATPase subunit 2
MSEGWGLASALAAGVLLGAIFFGGLWWTVRQGVSSKWVSLWFFGSMLLRTSIVLIGFYAVSGNDWKGLLAALLGFIIARPIVMRLTGPAQKPSQLARKANHAP